MEEVSWESFERLDVRAALRREAEQSEHHTVKAWLLQAGNASGQLCQEQESESGYTSSFSHPYHGAAPRKCRVQHQFW